MARKQGSAILAVMLAGALPGGMSLGAMSLGAVSPAGAQSADPERGYATQSFTPKGFRLPGGEGCAGDVARWTAVQDNDYASGNISLAIYHQIQAEIARAQSACEGGQDARARALVRDSKRRHGYPG